MNFYAFRHIIKIHFLIVLIGGLYCLPVQAAVSISVTSFEGGSTLNFGNLSHSSLVSREIEIKINSSDATPYQIRQLILQPLTSQKGETLRDDVLSFYTVRGSNASGSLYKTVREFLSFNDELLYISDPAGTPDTFKLVYVFNGKELASMGSFFGRIGYVLDTKEGQSQNVVFNVEFDVQGEWDVKLKSGRSPLRLSTRSGKDSSGYVDFRIESNTGKELNIYQRAEFLPSNAQGTRLPEGSLKFHVSSSSSAPGQYRTPSVLERGELLIYQSREKSDNLRVNFIIDNQKLKQAESGTYRGRLIYRAQEEGEDKVIPFDIEVAVEKMFDMKVSSEGLFFNIKSWEDPFPPEKIVQIDVESNVERPFQVSQMFSQPLTDTEGHQISEENFLMRQELLSGQGEVASPQFQPVKTGERVIFTSDSKGEDASLRVIYRLTSSPDIPAGNYSASLTYSLSEK